MEVRDNDFREVVGEFVDMYDTGKEKGRGGGTFKI